MSWSIIIDHASSVGREASKNPKVVKTVNSIVPTVVGLAASHATGGSKIAKATAKTATRAVIRKAPKKSAEIAVTLGTAVALDLATPFFIVGMAGYLAVKGIGKALDALDKALS